VTKNAGGIDRRTVAVGVVGLLFVLALAPAVAGGGLALEDGIYRVGVAEDSVYHAPVADDATFRVVEPEPGLVADGGAELLVRGGEVEVADSEKGRAALAELRSTVSSFNDRRMRAEANQSAAYPVFPVTLEYVDRGSAGAADGDGGAGDGAGAGGDGSDDAGGSDGTDGGAGDGGSDDGGGLPSVGGGQFAVPGLSGGIFGGGGGAGTPSDLAPPFPFGSLVLAFVFVIPLNFVIQAYGSSVLSERLNRRGELLLVSPVAPREIVAGKTLPYFAGALAVTAAIAVLVGGGPLSVLGVAPLALLFLAASFVGAMFARSFKELTFVTVTISVLLMTFAFVPAIFTDVGSVALISPLTLVVRDLTATPVGPGGVAFAVLPSTLTALLLFVLGTGVYREEDMFTQRPVHLKAMDALAARVRRARSLVPVVALLIPFVFVAELLAVALLFALPGGLSVVLLLTVVAVIEELAKSLPVYAGFLHARYERTVRAGLVAGAFAGLGFFLGEKLTLIVQLVGLPEQVPAGSATFQTGATTGPLVAGVLLLAPLALHVATAALSAVGASRSRDGYLLGITTAICVHVAYNLAVVVYLV
jgi:ABC-type Na+ efflux pump permease subunit